MLENKGQFVAGLELQRSRLKVSEYLGTLPGIRLTQAIPTSRQIGRDTFPYPLPIMPSIPGSNHMSLTSTAEGHCLYGRIDRFFVPDLLLPRGLTNIDDLLKVEDITGVEVYIVQRDMPPEWRPWAFLQNWVAIGDPYNSLMGTTSRAGTGDLQKMPDPRQSQNPLHPPRDSVWMGVPAMPYIYNLPRPLAEQIGIGTEPLPIGPCGFIQIWTRVAW